MKKKILFVVTEDWYFLSHRLSLAKYLINKDFEVYVNCKNTGKLEEIKKNNIYHYDLDSKRKSLSLIYFYKELITVIKVIKKTNPDIVHLISMRPIILGMIASLFVKSNFCATFTGMGFLFIKRGLKGIILRNLIMACLRICYRLKKAFFIVQNQDDQFFLSNKLNLKKKYLKIIRGSGIDLEHYKYSPEIRKKNIRLAYAGRILKDKGIIWLIEAFKMAKKKYVNLELYIAGSLDKRNPSSLSRNYFNKLISTNGVFYIGNIENIKKFWKESNIAILLSKREGLPLSLLEAAAIGRAIIATDVPGSREIAINNFNAIKVTPGNILECSEAILKLSKNKKLREKYGKNSRKLVENDMALKNVCEQYYGLYNDMSS
jgi:glycosyltransferase involved in cell wall biosynthesis